MTRDKDKGEFNWHPDRPQLKVIGPTCGNCKRPLIVTEGKCLVCNATV